MLKLLSKHLTEFLWTHSQNMHASIERWCQGMGLLLLHVLPRL